MGHRLVKCVRAENKQLRYCKESLFLRFACRIITISKTQYSLLLITILTISFKTGQFLNKLKLRLPCYLRNGNKIHYSRFIIQDGTQNADV